MLLQIVQDQYAALGGSTATRQKQAIKCLFVTDQWQDFIMTLIKGEVFLYGQVPRSMRVGNLTWDWRLWRNVCFCSGFR